MGKKQEKTKKLTINVEKTEIFEENYEEYPPYYYNQENNSWEEYNKKITKKSTKEIKELTIISYNIWFDLYYEKERNNELFKIIKNADFICLQEGL
jgi:hypothetical protein